MESPGELFGITSNAPPESDKDSLPSPSSAGIQISLKRKSNTSKKVSFSPLHVCFPPVDWSSIPYESSDSYAIDIIREGSLLSSNKLWNSKQGCTYIKNFILIGSVSSYEKSHPHPCSKGSPGKSEDVSADSTDTTENVGESNSDEISIAGKDVASDSCTAGLDNDIVYPNPCVSRRHLIIVLLPVKYVELENGPDETSDMGEEAIVSLYAYDPGSTYGTYLNNNLIVKQTLVRLNDGDMLKLGNNTQRAKRIFMVNYTPVVFPLPAGIRSTATSGATGEIEDNVGMETSNAVEDDGESEAVLDLSKMRTALIKRRGITVGSTRADSATKTSDKDPDGANSDVVGMDNQGVTGNTDDDPFLDEFDAKEGEDMQSVVLMDKSMYDTSLYDEDDDFFDRSVPNSTITISKKSILKKGSKNKFSATKINKMIDELNVERRKLLNTQRDLDEAALTRKGITSTAGAAAEEPEDADPLDAFMSSNSCQLDKDNQKHVKSRLREIRETVKEYHRILKKIRV